MNKNTKVEKQRKLTLAQQQKEHKRQENIRLKAERKAERIAIDKQKILDKAVKKEERKEQRKLKNEEKRTKLQQKKIDRKNNRLLARFNKKQEKLARKQRKLLKHQEKEVSIPNQIRLIAKEQSYTKSDWYKLDNAALIYPAIARDSNALFRLCVTMCEDVDPIALQHALNIVVPRFPTITSSLKAGLFWWYLDVPTTPLVIEKQNGFPCKPLRLDHRRSTIRVTYYKKEIAIEFFHSSTDGSGGLVFLNCLVATYLEYKGIAILDRTNCPNPMDKPRYEEVVDSFQHAKNNQRLPSPEKIKAKHMQSKPLPNDGLLYHKFICDSNTLKDASKKYGVSITQFLTACVLQSLSDQMKDTLNNDKRPIRVSVPINLRKMYNSVTLRNFSSYFYVQYTGGTFEELVQSVKSQFQQKATLSYVQSNINYNTKSQNNVLMRIVPLPLKNMVLKMVYHNLGYKQNSSSLSNLGVVSAPEEFKNHVVRYDFSFGRTFCEPIGVTVATYNDITSIVCNTIIKDTQFQRHFIKYLVDNGVNTVIESTEGDGI